MLKVIAALFALVAFPVLAQPLTPAEAAQIDQIVTRELAADQVPSAEIAIVRDGKIVLNKAYGRASATLPANPDLPY
ncbi:MAG: serine hydrolase domain-containing protein, partial [Sphingomicrobium sp.]